MFQEIGKVIKLHFQHVLFCYSCFKLRTLLQPKFSTVESPTTEDHCIYRHHHQIKTQFVHVRKLLCSNWLDTRNAEDRQNYQHHDKQQFHVSNMLMLCSHIVFTETS